jgi:hypothetical protein
MKYEKNIVFWLEGGLSNKLIAYFAVKALSQHLKRNLIVCWTSHLKQNITTSLLEMFDDEQIDVIGQSEYNGMSKDSNIMVIKNDEFRKRKLSDIESIESDTILVQGVIWLSQYVPIGFTPKMIVGHTKDLYHKLKLKKCITDNLVDVPSNTVSLHIRKHLKGVDVPVSIYEDIIKKEREEDPQVHFFICSDDIEEKEKVMNLCKNNYHICNVKTFWKDGGTDCMIDSMLDLLTIRQTKKVYTPRGSTFVQCIGWYDTHIEVVRI